MNARLDNKTADACCAANHTSCMLSVHQYSQDLIGLFWLMKLAAVAHCVFRKLASCICCLLAQPSIGSLHHGTLLLKHATERQHDSRPEANLCAGHHMLPVAIGCQDPASTDAMLTDTIMLHEDHDRDAGDTLMMAFDKGTFTKVLLLASLVSQLFNTCNNTQAAA